MRRRFTVHREEMLGIGIYSMSIDYSKNASDSTERLLTTINGNRGQ